MIIRPFSLVFAVLFFAVASASSQETQNSYQAFAQKYALQFREGDQAPATIDDWNQRRSTLRNNLAKAFGGFPKSDCDLEPRILGEIRRDDYRIEKLVFQTRPGVWMTANAYVPDKSGKVPAILHVHGHWTGAKQDPVVQSRCIGCVKLGFFVLCVDAFGAGERAIGKKLGEYHGEMTAATLLPIGLPLAGLQVYENRRAVDYLMTRPEVDPQRIGITGASGGGNQTMYAGAMDERLKCVIPTCSVGTYQSYLNAACCLCELIPGGLKITEEGDILGLAANRGLMVTTATKDAFQFSVGEAKKSMARVESIARLYPSAKVKHTIIESPHAYNQPMREAMYGWMTLHLKSEGDGSPIPDPTIQPEEPESLRCFPGESRPDDFMTIPAFAAAEANRLAGERTLPESRAALEHSKEARVQKLTELLGGFPKPSPLNLKVENDPDGKCRTLTFETEPGLILTARHDWPKSTDRLAILLDLEDGSEKAWSGEQAKQLRADGWNVVAPELRATGRLSVPRDQIGNAIDHNSAEWAIWIGRPLLGQWVYDIRRTLDAIKERDGSSPSDVLLVGRGSSGTLALFAASLDGRIKSVKAIDSLSSYATDKKYRDLRLGLMVPGILRDFGDISDVAALVAPRQVTFQGGRNGAGVAEVRETLHQRFASARKAYDLFETPDSLQISSAEN